MALLYAPSLKQATVCGRVGLFPKNREKVLDFIISKYSGGRIALKLTSIFKSCLSKCMCIHTLGLLDIWPLFGCLG